MKKQNYEAPVMEQMEVTIEKNFLGTGSGESIQHTYGGSWDAES